MLHEKTASLLAIGGTRGLTLIPASSPLTRLHYFDGKLLRADHLELEQRYVRQLSALSNQAGGSGLVHGFDCTLAGGDRLEIGAGLAIDPAGRVLLLPQESEVSLAELIEASRRREEARQLRTRARSRAAFQPCEPRAEEPGTDLFEGTSLYVITLAHAEAFCGEEDVFGKLCEPACITSTDRPYVVEGVVVRALPLTFPALPWSKAFPLTRLHLRSRVASAYFEDERQRVASLISAEGLASETWCLGADAEGGTDVPIAVVARAGATTVFLDAWTVRRERMETPPRRYWAGRMAMRPWNVFLAQVLQFQCQLRDGLTGGGGVDPDPCADDRGLLREADRRLGSLLEFYGQVAGRLANLDVREPEDLKEIRALRERLAAPRIKAFAGTDRILLRRGIVELPSAGYLPVVPGSSLTVNQQVQRLLGPGVDLRFCIVRPDFVPHALEEAQHMERISLLQGLDDPRNKPEVDILVPDGKIAGSRLAEGLGYRVSLTLLSGQRSKRALSGIARAETLVSGGAALYFAGAEKVTDAAAARGDMRFWADLRCAEDPFLLPPGGATSASLRAVIGDGSSIADFRLQGDVRIEATTGGRRIAGILAGHSVHISKQPDEEKESEVEVQQIGFKVQLEGDPSEGELTISAGSVKTPNEKIEARVAWKDSPQSVEGELRNLKDGKTEPMLQAGLLEDGDVLRVGGLAHEQALEMLKLLGEAIEDAGFADASARLLFATAPAGGGLELTATRDWVLFHRRRTMVCSTVAVQPDLAPARRYRVLHLKETPQILDKVREQLQKGQPPEAQIQGVTDVEFSGGLATLKTGPAEIAKAWAGAEPGPALYAGLIASQANANDGEALAAARLGRFRQELATPDVPGASLEVLPPRSLSSGVDGVIVLLTVEQVEVETICHTVYRVDSLDALKRLHVLAEQGALTEANLVEFGATQLGSVDYQAEDAILIAGSEAGVVAAWSDQGVPVGLLVVPGPDDPGDPELRRKQAKLLLAPLDGSASQLQIDIVVKSQTTLPSPCPVATFFVAG